MKRNKSWANSPTYEGASVRAGILETAIYPDGTPVAQVGFWNEYGTRTAPVRSFMRSTVEEHKQGWAVIFGKLLQHNDVNKSLNAVGAEMAGELTQAITLFSDPSNAPSTIAKKGFDKPLIDDGTMSRSISWEVQDEP